MGELVDEVRGSFGIAAGAEISLEADPGTFDAAKLRAYMDVGVNRISMGVQVRRPVAVHC